MVHPLEDVAYWSPSLMEPYRKGVINKTCPIWIRVYKIT